MGGDADPYDVAYFANFLQQQQIAPVKVGWYSGKQELPDGFPIRNFQYIKLGPYVESRGGLKSEQTNQRLYKIVQGEMNDITYRVQDKELISFRLNRNYKVLFKPDNKASRLRAIHPFWL